MSNKVLTLREMVLTALQANNQQPVKPSEIASQIKENFPEYCEQKIKSTTQANFDVVKQIAREITASSKLWMKKHPQLKCSEETPRTYWWENGDADVQLAEPANETEKLETKPYAQEEKALYNKLAAYLVGMHSRKLYPMRINEGTSSNTKGKNGNKHLHPDLVAMEDIMPSPIWSNDMKRWARKTGAQQTKLWSFEVKSRFELPFRGAGRISPSAGKFGLGKLRISCSKAYFKECVQRTSGASRTAWRRRHFTEH